MTQNTIQYLVIIVAASTTGMLAAIPFSGQPIAAMYGGSVIGGITGLLVNSVLRQN
ncbi:hypothetical protein [Salinibaculum rarum]|uniref:hypothetical protein n=1 Tax=Salinibaculum rarum TaxID=3058903 RepID=UPI00265E0158|nr:hypothetical protein [Salinibaculum sp. KK48]